MTAADSQAEKTGRISGNREEDRPFPHDLSPERAVLSAMLLEPDPSVEIVISKLGENPVFYSPRHQRLYDTICGLYKDQVGIDIISVSHALTKAGILEDLGGEAFLAELMNSLTTTANLDSWCDLVRDFAILRKLIVTCEDIKNKCYQQDTDSEVSGLLDEVETTILDVRDLGHENEVFELKDLMKEGFEYLMKLSEKDESRSGLQTHFPDLDKLVMGLKNGEMIVLAARPSIGKTSLALNIISNIALHRTHPRPSDFSAWK